MSSPKALMKLHYPQQCYQLSIGLAISLHYCTSMCLSTWTWKMLSQEMMCPGVRFTPSPNHRNALSNWENNMPARIILNRAHHVILYRWGFFGLMCCPVTLITRHTYLHSLDVVALDDVDFEWDGGHLVSSLLLLTQMTNFTQQGTHKALVQLLPGGIKGRGGIEGR